MPFNVPTTREIIRTGLQDLEVELNQQVPIVGVERALNIAFSGALRDVYDYQTWIVNQIIPSDKSDDETIIDTARNEGVIRKAAQYAAGPAVFTGNSPLPLDTEMQTQDGVRYHVIATESPVAGKVRVTIQANEVGTSGNLKSGDVVTLISLFRASTVTVWLLTRACPAVPISRPSTNYWCACCIASATLPSGAHCMILSSGPPRRRALAEPGRSIAGMASVPLAWHGYMTSETTLPQPRQTER